MYIIHSSITHVLFPISPMQQDRLARENMIAEQNRAYQESLDADREKVRSSSFISVAYSRVCLLFVRRDKE